MSELPYLLSPSPTVRERANSPPPTHFGGPLLLGPYIYGNNSGANIQVSPPREPFAEITSHLSSRDAPERRKKHTTVAILEKSAHRFKVLPLAQIPLSKEDRSSLSSQSTQSTANRNWEEGLRHVRFASAGPSSTQPSGSRDSAMEFFKIMEKTNHQERHRTTPLPSRDPDSLGNPPAEARKSILKTSRDRPVTPETSRTPVTLGDHITTTPKSGSRSPRRSRTSSEISNSGHGRRATDSSVPSASRAVVRDREELALRRQAIYRDAQTSTPIAYPSSSDENVAGKSANRARCTMAAGALTPSTTASTLDSSSSTGGRQTKSAIFAAAPKAAPSEIALRRRIVLADLDLNTLSARISTRPAAAARARLPMPRAAPVPCRPLRITKRSDRASLDAVGRANADASPFNPETCHPIVRGLMQDLDRAIESWKDLAL